MRLTRRRPAIGMLTGMVGVGRPVWTDMVLAAGLAAVVVAGTLAVGAGQTDRSRPLDLLGLFSAGGGGGRDRGIAADGPVGGAGGRDRW
ncbi:hypothetical protein [Kutzneria sp. 744]|uniref:hypothetical protein n=1 Tax=Kutzneria sp. (strain 744) TaxID=345341 RepID=UPI0012F9F52F|nr:hypothetical protein [Kutzneria sp. 744]